jgi:outer membrane phospholipase A
MATVVTLFVSAAPSGAAFGEAVAPVTPPPAEQPERLVRAASSPPTTAVPDAVEGDAESQYFFLHDINYFAVRLNEGTPPEVKFQVSVRFKMLRLGAHYQHAVNFAYSQTTYWDLFDTNASEPVNELNYRPELFYSYQGSDQRYREVQVGYLHDSNGLGVLPNDPLQKGNSRGWNTIFAQGRWGLSRQGASEPWFYPSVGLRLWCPFIYTPGLEKQMGYGQLWLDVDLSVPNHPRIGRLTNRLIVRMHSVEDDLLYPIMPVVTNNRVRLWVFGQIFYGEAESLLTPQSVTHLYAGLAFQ